MKKRIQLSGGSHNSKAINVVVSADAYGDFQKGFAGLNEILSKSQRGKLERHFCGIKSCTCGSYLRAHIEVI